MIWPATLATDRPVGVMLDLPDTEAIESFPCFGGHCSVRVRGRTAEATARQSARYGKSRLLAWHAQFTRFDKDSELSRLNRDPREVVPVTSSMAAFVQAATGAADMTSGLVDPTMVAQLERAGYADHMEPSLLSLERTLALAPARVAARPPRDSPWPDIRVDRQRSRVIRPAGVQLDSGGVGKGLFGDWLADRLAAHETFAVEAAGDIRFGGSANLARLVNVASPFDDATLHVFELVRGAAATSGIGRRSWLDDRGRPAHHLLDPSTGAPAFTGLVQVTALAPRALEAEILSKAALLSGSPEASAWLPYGGVIVHDSGNYDVLEPTGMHDE